MGKDGKTSGMREGPEWGEVNAWDGKEVLKGFSGWGGAGVVMGRGGHWGSTEGAGVDVIVIFVV